ncbi:hypothetical protein Cni_G03439 [Canna indica]|uniref:MOSC domain-containing protein n=1 Tax=Canna indica TaxID=4628 RepID=A0AAQ3Q3D5_9LILI|nr:hypothetical protein Cni_G03439 [Canna indica]
MEKASSILASIFGSRDPSTPAATVTSIFVYPIKSCRGISLPQACITSTGFRWDRQWVVVNSKGRQYTQRVAPKLALVEIELPMDAFMEDWEPTNDSYMVIKAPEMEMLRIPLNKECEVINDISVWDWSGSALDEGNDAFEWFTKYLGKPSRLVRFNTESQIRAVDPNYAQGYKTVFSDGFPFLLASQGSFNALNALLEEPLPTNRFRANIIVDGCDPFSEDLWKEMKINKLTFYGVKLCSRCKVPTINQENGTAGSSEPTETLMKFRSDKVMNLNKKQGKVFFGQNLVCKESLSPHVKGKVVAVGDPVYVLQKFSSPADAPI